MANVELINLVSTRLVQQKRELEFELRNSLNFDPTNKIHGVGTMMVDNVTTTLTRYNQTVNDIQLWESLLDEITNVPEKEEDNNN